MKVPIELIRQDNKFAFDTSDIWVPNLPILKTNIDTVILANFSIRVKNAELQMLEVEDFIITKIAELHDLDVDEQYLDNSELLALLDILQRVVEEMSDVRSLLASAINKYISLSNTIIAKNAQLQGVENSVEKIETKLKEEFEKLRDSTEIMFKSRAYYKTLDVSLLEFLNLDAGLQIDKIIATLIATLNTLADMRLRASKVKITIIEIEDLLYVYECWAQQLKVLATKLLELFGNLFLEAQELWMHLISGSYIRGGTNVQLNRNCTKITVNATRPELTECKEPKFLNTPSAEFNMTEAQEQYCPPCITTTTTTTAAPTASPTASPTAAPTAAPLQFCLIEIVDGNENRIIDDDLDLYVDGKFVQTFPGSTNAETITTIKVPAGSSVNFEFRQKKANGRNTFKELVIRYAGSKKLILEDKLSAYWKEEGTVIWSKALSISCSGSDAAPTVAPPPTSAPPTSAPPPTYSPALTLSIPHNQKCNITYTATVMLRGFRPNTTYTVQTWAKSPSYQNGTPVQILSRSVSTDAYGNASYTYPILYTTGAIQPGDYTYWLHIDSENINSNFVLTSFSCTPTAAPPTAPPPVVVPTNKPTVLPPIVVPTNTPTAAPTCTRQLLALDYNTNYVVDDDLDLFVNGKFIGTFLGKVQADGKFNFTVTSGTVLFELKFKKSNGKNTNKEIQVELVGLPMGVFRETVTCPSTMAIGSVVWSKSYIVKCR